MTEAEPVPSPTAGAAATTRAAGGRAGAPGEGPAVIHAVLSLDLGGLERVVVDLVREGVKLGQRVTVLCLETRGTLAPQVEALGGQVVCVGKPPGRSREAVTTIAEVLRRLRPDVLHAHQCAALLHAGPAARRAGVPLVVHTEHSNHVANQPTFAGRLRMRLLWRAAGRYAAHFFCVSADIAREARRFGVLPARKVSVMANGIDTSVFDRPPGESAALRREMGSHCDTSPVVGTVARLTEVKRQDVLIRGFAIARKRVPDARLLIVGDGPLKSELRELAAGLGLGEAVHFAGYQSQPERYLKAMDVFAITSRIEGMPLSVLEAWAAGVPVVGSRVGGLPEIIKPEVNGLLFDSGDERALAAALADLLLDRDRSRRMGGAGRAMVEARYSARAMAENYANQYREMIVATGGGVAGGGTGGGRAS